MYLIRETCPYTSPTPRDYMDWLVNLGIGFRYDENNDYYVWQTADMNEPAPFYIDINNHVKANWESGNFNSSANYQTFIYTKMSDTSITRFNSEGNNGNIRFIFDYAKAGNNLFYKAATNNTTPTAFTNFFIAPVTENDSWLLNNGTYLWDLKADRGTWQALNQARDDGFASSPSVNCLRIGKWFNGYRQTFNDNLYIASVRPYLWEGGFAEYKVGDKVYFVWTPGGSTVGVAIDITDYIEEG